MEPAAVRLTNRQAQSAKTASDLKTAARAVFARQGYLNTKITDITHEAGRAAGSFYNHFESKEEVLTALAVDVGIDADKIAKDRPARSAGRSPLQVSAHAHLAVFWHAYAAHRDVFAAIDEAALVNAAFSERMQQFEEDQLRPWREWLTDAASRGAKLPAAPEVTAKVIQASAKVIIQSWDGDPEAGIDALTAFIVAGLSG